MEAGKQEHHLSVISATKWIERNNKSEIESVSRERRKMSMPDRTVSPKKKLPYS